MMEVMLVTFKYHKKDNFYLMLSWMACSVGSQPPQLKHIWNPWEKPIRKKTGLLPTDSLVSEPHFLLFSLGFLIAHITLFFVYRYTQRKGFNKHTHTGTQPPPYQDTHKFHYYPSNSLLLLPCSQPLSPNPNAGSH